MTVRSCLLVMTTVVATALALTFALFVGLPRWLLYNPTESAPRGWYLLRGSDALRPGDIALVRLPHEAAQLADARGYLPVGMPLIKQVAAAEGTEVCVRDGQVLVEGALSGRTLDRDRRGRGLAAWPGCRRLDADEFFLLSTSETASFDSRYFGPVPRESVLGRVVPLWTW